MKIKLKRHHILLLAWLPTVFLLSVNGIYQTIATEYSQSLRWLLDLLEHCVVPGISVWLLYRIAAVGPSQYGWTWRGGLATWRAMCMAVFVITLYPLVYHGSIQIIQSWPVFWKVPEMFARSTPDDQGAMRVIRVLYWSFSAGLVEETIYRGMPYLWMKARSADVTRRWFYPLVTSTLFALAHWETGSDNSLSCFVTWWITSIVYQRVPVLWPYVVAHIFIDIAVFSS